MIKQRFFKGFSWLLVLNIIIKPVWIFMIDRQVQNTVGLFDYGRYFSLFNLSYVLLFLADAGLTGMVSQQLASKPMNFLGQLLRWKTFLLFVYALTCFFIAWLAGITTWEWLTYLILIQATNSLFIFLRSIITAHQLFTTDAWFSVLDKFLLILFCSGFIYGLFMPISILIFLQMQLLATSLACVALGSVVWRKGLIRSCEERATIKVLKAIAPFAVIFLLMSVHYRLDGFLLERLRVDGATEAGKYALGYRLLEAGNMVGYLAASFLVPFIARNQMNRSIVNQVVLATRHVLVAMSLGAVAIMLVFPTWVQETLYNSKLPSADRILQLTMATLPAYMLVHIYGSVLTAYLKVKQFILILVAAVMANVLLNFVLIPKQGAAGAAIAAIVSQYACALALVITTNRIVTIKFFWKSVPAYFSGGGLLFLCLMFFKPILDNVWIMLVGLVVIVLLLIVLQKQKIKKLLIPLFKN